MTLEAALRAKLVADTDIFDQITNRVYVGPALVSTAYPCISITQVGDAALDDDVSKAYDEYLQFSCQAKSYSEASKLADTVKNLLRSYAMRNTQLTDSDDTFTVIDSTYKGSRIYRDDSGIFHSPVDFAIEYNRA